MIDISLKITRIIIKKFLNFYKLINQNNDKYILNFEIFC